MTRLIADTGPTAGAGDFGANTSGLVDGLATAGGAIASVAQNQILRAEAERKKAEEAAEKQQALDEELEATKEMARIRTQYVEQFTTGAAETPEKFNENYQKLIDSTMQGKEEWLPSTRAKLEEALYNLGPSLVDNNISNLAKVNLQKRQDNFAETLNSFAQAAQLDGDFSSARAATKSLKTQVGASIGSSGDKAYQRALSNLDLSEVQKASTSKTPGVAATALRNKKLAPDMDDYARESLASNLDREEEAQAETNLNAMREAAASLQSSATAGDSNSLMQIEGANKILEAARLRYEAARKPIADQDSALLSKMDDVISKGKDAGFKEPQLSALRSQLSLSTAATAMKGSSPEEIQGVVQRRIDKFGPGSVEAVQATEAGRAAVANLSKDPFAYVMQDPGLQNTFSKAQASGNPQDFQAVLETVVNRQQRFGIGQPAVMDVGTAEQTASRLRRMAAGVPVAGANGVMRKMSPDELVSEIDGISTRYGKFASQALANLSTMPSKENQLPVELQVIAALPPQNSILRAQLAQSLDDSQPEPGKVKTAFDVKAEKINTELAGNPTFQQFATSLWFATPDNGRAQSQQWGEAISRRAENLLYTGQAKNEKQAVEKATSDIVGSVWDIQDGLRIPRAQDNGTPRDTTKTALSLDAIKVALVPKLDVSRWAPAVPGMDEKKREILGQKKISSTLAWITAEDGTGANLMATDDRGQLTPMFTKTGKRVSIDFSKADSVPMKSVGIGGDMTLFSSPRTAPDITEKSVLDMLR